jgi:hypothetical protein
VNFGQADTSLPAPTSDWPNLPLVISEELPFLLVGGYFVGGAMRSARDTLATYIAQGQLRKVPLRPAAPETAVEALVGGEQWSSSLLADQEPRVRAMLYAQALRAAAPAYSFGETEAQAFATATKATLPALWSRHRSALDALRLVWDEETQRFISRQPDTAQPS